MKTLIRLALAAAIILPLLGLVDHFWLKPQIEAQISRSLTTPGTDTGAVEGTARQGRVQSVEFKSFSGRLHIHGLDIMLEHDQGPVRYEIGELSLKLPFAVTLLYTPLRSLFLPDKGLATLAENLQMRDIRISSMDGSLSIQRKEASVVQMDGSLIQRLFSADEPASEVARTTAAHSGDTPPETGSTADSGPEGISLDTFIRSLALHDSRAVFVTLDVPTASEPLKLNIKEIRTQHWQQQRVDQIDMEHLTLQLAQQDMLHLASLQLRGLTLPSGAVLDTLADFAAADTVAEQKALARQLDELLAGSSPLVEHLLLKKLDMTLPSGEATLAAAQLDWFGNAPYNQRISFEELSLPSEALDNLRVPGLKKLLASGFVNIMEEGEGFLLHECHVEAPHLGTLDLSFSKAGNGLSAQDILQSGSYKNVKLRLADQGFMARLALLSVPEEQAAENLAASIYGFIGTTRPANKALADALVTYVRHPGTLELRSTPDRTFLTIELLGLGMAQELGQLFTAEATPGREALQEQIARIVAACRPPEAAQSSEVRQEPADVLDDEDR